MSNRNRLALGWGFGLFAIYEYNFGCSYIEKVPLLRAARSAFTDFHIILSFVKRFCLLFIRTYTHGKV